ncbi:abc transporter [Moniliophthora roreri]|nr:abc transporter [Moniliophthora roreri]
MSCKFRALEMEQTSLVQVQHPLHDSVLFAGHFDVNQRNARPLAHPSENASLFHPKVLGRIKLLDLTSVQHANTVISNDRPETMGNAQ